MTFGLGVRVRHLKTQHVYAILAVPSDGVRLESTGEPAYIYGDGGPYLWVRGQTEMEDGRFEVVL